jgi:3-methylcrotonyl-CoA carboxylase alpha subunit
MRAGEESAAAGAAAGPKKGVRVRAQMPGKIISISAKPGDVVEKEQPLLVMEAMKMENVIRAPQAGKIGQVKVTAGQAVETGADLCVIDPV